VKDEVLKALELNLKIIFADYPINFDFIAKSQHKK
jgi:hypothetical protein